MIKNVLYSKKELIQECFCHIQKYGLKIQGMIVQDNSAVSSFLESKHYFCKHKIALNNNINTYTCNILRCILHLYNLNAFLLDDKYNQPHSIPISGNFRASVGQTNSLFSICVTVLQFMVTAQSAFLILSIHFSN